MKEVFEDYADYYDLIYQNKNYKAETSYVKQLLEKHKSDITNVLEIGCGTGMHAVELCLTSNYRVHGIDLSSKMISLAKAKLPQQLLNRLTFSLGDSRDFVINDKFDVATSLFHVMSYQTSNSDLRQTFETVARHLKPGGIFVFDYWYGPAVLSELPETRVKRFEDKNYKITRIAEPQTDTCSCKVTVNYELLIESKTTGAHYKIRENHKLRYLFLPEIEELCSKYFTIKEHLGWMSNNEPSNSNWAGVSILEKIQ